MQVTWERVTEFATGSLRAAEGVCAVLTQPVFTVEGSGSPHGWPRVPACASVHVRARSVWVLSGLGAGEESEHPAAGSGRRCVGGCDGAEWAGLGQVWWACPPVADPVERVGAGGL